MAAMAEWWRGWIITREGDRVVIGTRYTDTGIIIRRNPRLRWMQYALECLLLIATVSIAARIGHLPRPLTPAVLVAWIAARFLVSRGLPQLSQTIVLDDEHLSVESAPLLPRRALIARSDIRDVIAGECAVLVRKRCGRVVGLPLASLTNQTARAIAELLEEARRGV
jgi:hypothetical protein